jgi:hypothetical protein
MYSCKKSDSQLGHVNDDKIFYLINIQTESALMSSLDKLELFTIKKSLYNTSA